MKKLILVLIALVSFQITTNAQVSVSLTPIPGPFLYTNGPLTGGSLAFGCVFTFASNSTSPLATYTDASGTVSNPNPVPLNAGGFAQIWFISGLEYTIKVVSSGGINCASGQTQYAVNNLNTSLLNLANEWQQPQTFDDPITILAPDLQIVFGASSGNQTTLDMSPTTGNYILHAPPITGNDTLVSVAAVQNLNNKNLNSPQINGCQMAGATGSGPGTYACIQNANPTGTESNALVKLVGGQATVTTTSDTSGIIGVCSDNCNNTGLASVQQTGVGPCGFDGGTTAGDYVQASTTSAGLCHDTGATYPSSGEIIGQVLSTNSGGGNYNILLSTNSNSSFAGCVSTTPATLANSSILTNLLSCVIPANALTVGSLLEIDSLGTVGGLSGDNLQLYVSFGGSPSCGVEPQMLGGSSQLWNSVGKFAITSTGVSGTAVASCEYFSSSDGGGVVGPEGAMGAIVINTTIANTIQISAQWGVASASNSLTQSVLKATVF